MNNKKEKIKVKSESTNENTKISPKILDVIDKLLEEKINILRGVS